MSEEPDEETLDEMRERLEEAEFSVSCANCTSQIAPIGT
jgi:hypothetical protein